MDNRVVVGFCGLGQPKPDFIDCMVKLLVSGHVHGYVMTNATLLPYARNNVIKNIFKLYPEFTHVLMVDDDMNRFDPQGVKQLLDADKPIISALMLKRGLPFQAVHKFDGQTPEKITEDFKKGEPQPVVFCGMAFTLVKREVFESIQEETNKDPIWFNTDREPRKTFSEEVEQFIIAKEHIAEEEYHKSEANIREHLTEAIIMGQQSHFGTYLVGEDAQFCTNAAKHGFQSWVHYGVPVGHIGEVTFDARDIA